MKNAYGKVVLVSGASSGIGAAIAQRLAQEGLRVYGAYRRGNWYDPPKRFPASPDQVGKQGRKAGFLQSLPMDVCDPASVKAGIEEILRLESKIDILINCAGNGIAGAMEDTSDAESRFQMETNFFGTLNVCRAALPTMRAQKSGLILNISSVAGILPIPFQGMYSASKYAVLAASQALRMELAPFGVKVAVLLPGDTCTGFTDARKFAAASGASSAYRDRCRRAVSDMERSEREGKPPSTVADTAVKLIGKRNPAIAKYIGWENKCIRFAARLAPDKFMLWAMRKFYHC